MSSKNSEHVLTGSSEVTLYPGVLSRAATGFFRLSFIPDQLCIAFPDISLGRVNLSRQEQENSSSEVILSLASVRYNRFVWLGECLGLKRSGDFTFEGEI